MCSLPEKLSSQNFEELHLNGNAMLIGNQTKPQEARARCPATQKSLHDYFFPSHTTVLGWIFILSYSIITTNYLFITHSHSMENGQRLMKTCGQNMAHKIPYTFI